MGRGITMSFITPRRCCWALCRRFSSQWPHLWGTTYFNLSVNEPLFDQLTQLHHQLHRTQSVGSVLSSCAADRCKRLNPALCKLCTETPSPAILSAVVATQARVFSRNRWLNMTEGKWESEVSDASRHSQITSRMHQIGLILHLALVISLA